jgi:hypothetical protein
MPLGWRNLASQVEKPHKLARPPPVFFLQIIFVRDEWRPRLLPIRMRLLRIRYVRQAREMPEMQTRPLRFLTPPRGRRYLLPRLEAVRRPPTATRDSGYPVLLLLPTSARKRSSTSVDGGGRG